MKQSFDVPDWLTTEYLAHAFSSKYGENVTIIDSVTDVGTQKGENFCSEMFRIKVTYSVPSVGGQSQMSVFVKKPHSAPEVSSIFEKCKMYENEMRVYAEFLPEFEKLLESVGENGHLGPQLIYCDLQRKAVMIEDMCERGFKTVDKKTRIKGETINKVLQKLAHFHAASVVMNERSNGQLEPYKSTIFAKDSNFKDMITQMVDAGITEILSWGSGYEKYHDGLWHMSKNLLPIMNNALQPSRPSMGVYMHGDMWTNNFLIQSDADGQPKVVALIDFQLGGWASRAVDLLYFIFTSLNEEDYEGRDRFNNVLKIYNDHYNEVMKKLDPKHMIDFEELTEEVFKKATYAIFATFFTKAVIYKEDQKTSDVNGLLCTDLDLIRNQHFKSKRFQEELKFLLKFMDEYNVWDICRETTMYT